MSISAYPLQWPVGWTRTEAAERTGARFGRFSHSRGARVVVTISEGTKRVRAELKRMKVSDNDLVISTNLQLRLDGLPRSGQAEPRDPGAAVYWIERAGDVPRCMAIDRYDRVADNLAAIAATLDAMRAIERHGGAEILSRAFTGFTAIENKSTDAWWVVLGVLPDSAPSVVRDAYHRLRSKNHPDRGSENEEFVRVSMAWDQYQQQAVTL